MRAAAASTRLNRYLSAAGLGQRREVEGLIKRRRVTVDRAVVDEPGFRVLAGADVRLDGERLKAPYATAVAFHRAPGAPLQIIHPEGLHAVAPLPPQQGGLELLLGDRSLAERLSDPARARERSDESGRRVSLVGVRLGELAAGDWRPLAPRERDSLVRAGRVGARRT